MVSESGRPAAASRSVAGTLADAPLAGVLFLVASGLLFTFLDAGNKTLTATYPVVQVVWARYTFQMLMVPVIVGRVNLAAAVRTQPTTSRSRWRGRCCCSWRARASSPRFATSRWPTPRRWPRSGRSC